ncbi:MAG TPA: M48 family metalloprotease [Thermoanaerobaculia bacterium]|nr:M48 family metalloprotease [Thermoanaerobaculia bacterium]
MRRSAAFRAVTLATLLLFAVSCASTQLPPISSQGRSFAPLRDEAALWEQSRAEEQKLLGDVKLYGDRELESYLEEVVGRLNPPAMASNPAVHYQVRVIEDPTLNAFAYPHGSIYVHTGLLARMEDEDELATVLGHEMTHVEYRHMLRYQRSAHNKAVGLSVAAITASVLLAVAEGDALDHGEWAKEEVLDVFGNLMVGLGLQLAFQASVNGYGRGLEEEADLGGFGKLAAAGYDLHEAPKVYQALLDDRGEPRKAEAFFFGSHPRLSERIAVTQRYVAQHPGATLAEDRVYREDAFARHIRPVVRDDARLNIDMGRLTLAESELRKAREWMPSDPETHFLRGRLRLAQATGKDPEEARGLRREAEDAFRKSIELDPGRPAPHRELGLLLRDREDLRGACVQLRRYQKLAPDAEDMEQIEDAVAALERGGGCG